MWINTNPLISAITILLSFLGFFVSLYSMFKVRSVDKALRYYKIEQEFEKNRMKYHNRLVGHSESIRVHEVNDRAIIHEIQKSVQIIFNSYYCMLKFKGRRSCKKLIGYGNIEHERIDFLKVVANLDTLAGCLYKEKENEK